MSDTSETLLHGKYNGTGKPLFWLAIKTTLLTFLTLGIYRFWAKTRIRRYIWSATAPDGDPFEYTGTGVEKLIGFLIAMVVLAIYLGITQVLLTFFGFSLMDMVSDPNAAPEDALRSVAVTYITLFALAPLIYFAQYRARRYMLSRTRWRGLRFGMDKAAVQYAWRGVMYLLISIFTLGLLLPLMVFRLEKFKADRTWYGDAKLEQGGTWKMLYKPFKHVLIGLGILIVGIILGIVLEAPGVAIAGGAIGYIWGIFGYIHFRVQSFAMMAEHKTLDGQVSFVSRPKTSEIIITYITGGLLVGVIFLCALAPVIGLVAWTVSEGDLMMIGGMGQVISIVSYLVGLAVAGSASLVFIAQPVLRHYVDTAAANNPQHLETIQQRVGDDIPDAEGFADALDIGGAF